MRAQDPNPATNLIKATDPRFDDYIAMSGEDFRKFLATYVYGCKQWKANVPMMSAQEAMDRFKVVIDEWQAEGARQP